MKDKIYVAGPLFSDAERAYNLRVKEILEQYDFDVWLPQERAAGLTDPQAIRDNCLEGIDWAGGVLAILDGADADSGTAFEMGYATAKDYPIDGIRSDFRGTGDDGGLNLMLSRSCTEIFKSVEDFCKSFL
jgi:nucleoside 2-deoxyribosyltransferase